MKKIKVVELFAGVGGFRLGLEKNKEFEVVWSNQWEPASKAQHASMFTLIDLVQMDIAMKILKQYQLVKSQIMTYYVEVSMSGLFGGFNSKKLKRINW